MTLLGHPCRARVPRTGRPPTPASWDRPPPPALSEVLTWAEGAGLLRIQGRRRWSQRSRGGKRGPSRQVLPPAPPGRF